LLVEVLEERLGLMQLLWVPGWKFDPLDLFLGHLSIGAGDLPVTQLATREGLHGDFYPLPPAGSPQELCVALERLTPPCGLAAHQGGGEEASEPILSNDGGGDHDRHAQDERCHHQSHGRVTM
jgi:hypothetical protein